MPTKAPLHNQAVTPKRQGHVDRNRTADHAFYCMAPWRRLRAAVLREQPLCQYCKKDGFITAATLVDHVIPIKQNPALKLERTNLVSSCDRCHNKKRATSDKFT